MSLPYTSPPDSLPGTPSHVSRPGTPSKTMRGILPALTSMIQDADSSTVLEKHLHISSSRFQPNNSHPPSLLRPLAPYFTALPIPIPKTGKLLLLPVPSILVVAPQRRSAPPLTPRRGPDGRYIHHSASRVKPSPLGFVVLLLLAVLAILRIRSHSPRLSIPFVPSSSNILNSEQIARVWQWEIGRGHYPSSRRLPTTVSLTGIPNPGVDASTWDNHPQYDGDKPVSNGLPRGPLRFPDQFSGRDAIRPAGPPRHYLNISQALPLPYGRPMETSPARPQPDSIIDLDIVMDYCDFTTGRYVRDCLEVLKTAAGLDRQHQYRRGKMEHWRHLFAEDRPRMSSIEADIRAAAQPDTTDIMQSLGYVQADPKALSPAVARDYQTVLSAPHRPSSAQIAEALQAPRLEKRQNIVGFGASARPHPTHPTADPLCDPDYPKIFHIFWAGPFTDKPYLAVTSFLFTQNLGLHLRADSPELHDLLSKVCRPQLWVWVNPGPAASLPNPRARKQMFDQLRGNPWSAPFLHPRFQEAVKFKLWNTTEQLDGIPELKDHWRALPLFNSGGVKFGAPAHKDDLERNIADDLEAEGDRADAEEDEEHGRFGKDAVENDAEHVDEALKVKGAGLNATAAPAVDTARHAAATPAKRKKKVDDMISRVGSTSSKDYDRLTVVLSDMARFVLTHRFGGIYLDADTIFLRDWEELWGWKGAFAYRWSRLEKYNTAVLKMHRNSAIGSFLFKSALANGLDFHPMTISRYTKDASLEGLLLRLPDALFDSAWLNTEYYQRDRPAYPYFKRFEDFFDPPKEDSAAPMAVGFEGFYRGAFSYHFHNFWWIPFDPARNWPDLGRRFEYNEKKARAIAMQARLAKELAHESQPADDSMSRSPTKPPQNGQMHPGGPTQIGETPNRLTHRTDRYESVDDIRIDNDDFRDDVRDLSWATVLKRTFEAYLREERPNMYGELIQYSDM